MKKMAACVLAFLFLAGCAGTTSELETGLDLRGRILKSSECTFTAEITADYGDEIHNFSLDCRSDNSGNVFFTVTAPETISGISGKLTGSSGSLIFEDTVLYFPLMADDQLSPVSAPWIFMKTLRSGYLASAGREEGNIRLSIDDSFEEDALRLDIWLDGEAIPEQADILYDGKRILTIGVKNFVIL